MTYVSREVEFGVYPPEIEVGPYPVVGFRGRVGESFLTQHPTVWQKVEPMWIDEGAALQPPDQAPGSNYVIDGILPTKWVKEVTSILPASFALFVEWGGVESEGKKADAAWEEAKSELVNSIHGAMGVCAARSVRVIVALVVVGPVGSEVWAERLADLAAAAGLGTDSFMHVVSPDVAANAEEARHSIVKLRRKLVEMAASHYHERVRQLRRDREGVNPQTQTPLAVRLGFQMGFYNELRGEPNKALDSYRKAAELLLQVRDRDVAEVKTVAEYISFRRCRLLVFTDKVAEAAMVLRETLGHYKDNKGEEERLFEHWAWMSRQYEMFAHLLRASKYKGDIRGVQQAGHYYYTAVSYERKRRESARTLCEGVERDDEAAHLDVEYYGQPPTARAHPLQVTAETEHAGATAEDHRAHALTTEASIDHTDRILNLLYNTMDTLCRKSSKSRRETNPRMRMRLSVELGHEFMAQANYERALEVFTSAASLYKSEGWSSILALILEQSVICAQELNQVDLYYKFLIELIAMDGVPLAVRLATQEQLQAALAGETGLPLSADMICDVGDTGMVDATVRVSDSGLRSYSSCAVSLCIKLKLPLPLRITQAHVRFAAPNEALTATVNVGEGSEGGYVVVYPEQDNAFPFSLGFEEPIDELVVESVELALHGSHAGTLTLRVDAPLFAVVSEGEEEEEVVSLVPTVRIVMLASKTTVDVESDSVILVNELYKLNINIRPNGEEMKDARLSIVVTASGPVNVYSEPGVELGPDDSLPVDLTTADADGVVRMCAYLKSRVMSEIRVNTRVTYSLARYETFSEHGQTLRVVAPFKVVCRYLSSTFEDLLTTYRYIPLRERFYLVASIRAEYKVDVALLGPRLSLTPPKEGGRVAPFSFNGSAAGSAEGMQPWTMNAGDCFDVVFDLTPNVAGDRLPLGKMGLAWCRSSKLGDTAFHTNFRVDLPIVLVRDPPFSAVFNSPPTVAMNEAFDVSVVVTNNTKYPQPMQSVVEDTPGFLYAGQQTSTFDILPKSTYTLSFVFIPLQVGRINLPRVKLTPYRREELPESKIVRHVFVQPGAAPPVRL